MSSRPEQALILIHKKTKQRYPLRGEDFVIGRSQGDLVFDHDPKLSGRHCLIRLTPQGFAIHDLKTRTGVHINGTQLPAGKACILKVGAEVTIGDQHFTVAQDRPRKHKRTSAHSSAWQPILFLFCALLLGGAWYFGMAKPNGVITQISPVNLSPANIDAEFEEAIRHLTAFGEALRRRELTEEQTLSAIRKDLLPRFTSVHQQLQAYRPAKGKLEPRLDFRRRISGAHVGQLTAMANFIQTKEVKYSMQMDQFQRQMEILMAQEAEESRRPSSLPEAN
ncbi:MAG: FHA domain-containing protein [Bdellovibrionales bacterium]|nr:FHA domain-containing protein [Bdellovibrionales bacterium]